jgi:hypothetical protein
MGKLGNKNRQRAARVFSEEAKQRIAVRKMMRRGLVNATEVQLYRRTPLPVTRRMRRSIYTVSDSNSITVGYKASVAPHAGIRLAKKGRSKLGKHDMAMNPAEFIEQTEGDRIARIGRGTLQRIMGA